MKAEILKISGCKTQKEFYSKFPSEEAFMKVHGKAFKKAQLGVAMSPVGSYTGGGVSNNLSPINARETYDDMDLNLTGKNDYMRQQEAYQQQMLEAQQAAAGQGGGEGGGEGMSADQMEQIMGMFGKGKHGIQVPKAQRGTLQPLSPRMTPDFKLPTPGVSSYMKGQKVGKGLLSSIPVIGGIVKGFKALKQEKYDRRDAQRTEKLSDIMSQANNMQVQPITRNYVRPEDNIISPNQMFPTYGVGTNPLTAQYGAEIQNTYAPNTLYDDLGYEPLSDSDIVKQYRAGGFVPKAQGGFSGFMDTIFPKGSGGVGGKGGVMSLLAPYGGSIGSKMGGGDFEENAGGQIGSSIGGIFGPVGQLAGGILGGMLDVEPQLKKKAIENTKNNMWSSVGGDVRRNLQSTGYIKNGGDISNYEEGGYMNPEYNPQIIANFGEYSMNQLLAPPKNADMLRAGGHLKEYTPPSERAMFTGKQFMKHGGQTSALNGQLKTTWGGDVETVSNNPYDEGSTVMFRGNSHTEGDGNGHTGIGVTYGKGEPDSYTDYAEYGTEQADAQVEVERGEPAQEMTDPETGEKNLIVYGDLKIPDYALSMLGDKNAKGKKFKNYVSDLTKKENKQTKILNKNTELINELEVDTPMAQLTFNSYEKNINGATNNLKQYSEYKNIAANIQSSINELSEENGLVAADLAKGKFTIDKEAMKEQQAKFGKSILKAQVGTKEPVYASYYDTPEYAAEEALMQNVSSDGIINPLEKLKEMLKNKGFDYKQTSGVRTGAKTKQGKPSRHSTGEAMDLAFPKLGKDSYNAILNDPDISRFMLDNNLTAINEYDDNIRNQTGGTEPHLHIGLDKGTAVSDKFRNDAKSLYSAKTPATTSTATSPNDDRVKEINKLYAIAEKTKKPSDIKKLKDTFHKYYPEKAEAIIKAYPMSNLGKKQKFTDFSKMTQKEILGTQNNIMGRRIKQYIASVNNVPAPVVNQIITPVVSTTPTTTSTTTPTPTVTKTETATKPTFPWQMYANQALNYLRPSDAEELDPSQLLGEMSAMGDRPSSVFAQKYIPELDNVYDISYQDQLNEITAQARAAERMAGQNPAAAAAIFGAASQNKSKVLAEQFRANQAMKAGVYDKNRATLNDAQLKNMGILDNQYVRQETANSTTKENIRNALNSISAKTAQNKLENRKLKTMENLYNYRYDSQGRLVNMNGIVQFDYQGNPITQSTQKGSNTVDIDGKKYRPIDYDNKTGQPIKFELVGKNGAKIKARNGSIVKAIKNL